MGTGSEPLSDPATLLGTWQLSRVIDDRSTGQESRIDGQLFLSAVSPHRIRWEAQGRWHQADGDVEVHRSLWVELSGDQWWVRFEDGRDFHPWSPGEGVVHECAPDTYRGVVSGSVQQWTVRWDVTGPHKDYSMTTLLTPQE